MGNLKNFFSDNNIIKLNIAIFSVIIFTSLLISSIFLKNISIQDKELTTEALFRGIYTAIDYEIDFPAEVAKTMCYDSLLLELLEQEGKIPQEEFNSKIGDYLRTIRDGHDWESAYLVSSKTMYYYTPQGYSKTVDPTKDDYDLWYTNFLDTGLEYAADMTYDQHNEKAWTIFIDRRMEVNGELRAVLGCAVYLSDVTEMIQQYSELYDVEIYFTDEDGNITLDKNGINIGEAYVKRERPSDMNVTTSSYSNGSYIVRRFVPLLGMYLVVENKNSVLSERFADFILIYLIFTFIVIALVIVLNLLLAKREKDSLNKKVRTDYLTKISNLNGIKNSVKMFINEKVSRSEGGTIFMFDIDHFKEVNDTFGHSKGDEALKKFAEILSKSFRAGDFVGRLGGDEFMVFSPCFNDHSVLVKKCSELLQVLSFEITDGEKTVSVSASIGVAIFPDNADTYDDLYKAADKALYHSKENGRNRYTFYSDI